MQYNSFKDLDLSRLGFSSHARPDTLERFLDYAGDSMEFCQIQLNYLDWTLQDAKAKYELLTERDIPVWVMEPVRGGRLCALSDEDTARLKAVRPGDSTAAWAFRWLQNLPNVKMVLSGMSNMEQMIDNVRTFSEGDPQLGGAVPPEGRGREEAKGGASINGRKAHSNIQKILGRSGGSGRQPGREPVLLPPRSHLLIRELLGGAPFLRR